MRRNVFDAQVVVDEEIVLSMPQFQWTGQRQGQAISNWLINACGNLSLRYLRVLNNFFQRFSLCVSSGSGVKKILSEGEERRKIFFFSPGNYFDFIWNSVKLAYICIVENKSTICFLLLFQENWLIVFLGNNLKKSLRNLGMKRSLRREGKDIMNTRYRNVVK